VESRRAGIGGLKANVGEHALPRALRASKSFSGSFMLKRVHLSRRRTKLSSEHPRRP
jgi:hypothetical protein